MPFKETVNTINRDNQNSEEFLGNEKDKGFIEIENIKITLEKEHFDYPENIQKETGILGYERSIIDKDSFFNFLNSDKNNHEIIKASGVKDFNSLMFFMEDIDKKIGKFVTSTGFHYRTEEEDQLYESDKYNAYEKLRFIIGNGINKVIKEMSGGEYPAHTLNHQLGAYQFNTIRTKYKEDFVKDRFFLQKIYDIENIKNIVDENSQENPYSQGDLSISGDRKVNVNIFDSKTLKMIKNHEGYDDKYTGHFALNNLAKEEYYQGIKDGKLFACTPCAGFNVATFDFFSDKNLYQTPSFGFSLKDKFFQKYLEKSLKTYLDICGEIDFPNTKQIRNYQNSLISTIAMIILSQKEIAESSDKDKDEYRPEFHQKVIEELEKLEKKYNFKIEKYLPKESRGEDPTLIESRRDWLLNFDHILFLEIHLPVFIGKNDIPQLSWGHAKYANFLSSKGLNYIEFKHSDKLLSEE